MKKVTHKNYAFLILIIVFTILITLYLSYIYSNKSKSVSEIYKYANVITYNDMDEYISENPDCIVYVGNKYNLDYTEFEKKLINVLDEYHLKDNFVFINVNNKIITKINKDYKVVLKINKIPYILIFVNGKIFEYNQISFDSNVKSIIGYEDFEW